jgi:16S rRNA (guanine527-N7)-methyltransferase
LSSSPQTDARLTEWLRRVLETPGLTAIGDLDAARRVLIEDCLHAVDVVARFEGPIIDVGSGSGSPGIPLAVMLPEREVVLLEANRRKCAFLEDVSGEFSNVRVVRGRAEEQGVDQFGVAVAKALAPPPVAAEWCLPLVAPGGAAVLYVGSTAKTDRMAEVAKQLAAKLVESPPGLLVLAKVGPTPPGFPRRPGVARKRPLA